MEVPVEKLDRRYVHDPEQTDRQFQGSVVAFSKERDQLKLSFFPNRSADCPFFLREVIRSAPKGP